MKFPYLLYPRLQPSDKLTYHRKPTKGEVKFGEGATHYKDFTVSDCMTKLNRLKQWLVCPIDDLRYYRDLL